ncbi:hypothetical protein A0H81_12513, partial [Grifola frondosa]
GSRSFPYCLVSLLSCWFFLARSFLACLRAPDDSLGFSLCFSMSSLCLSSVFLRALFSQDASRAFNILRWHSRRRALSSCADANASHHLPTSSRAFSTAIHNFRRVSSRLSTFSLLSSPSFEFSGQRPHGSLALRTRSRRGRVKRCVHAPASYLPDLPQFRLDSYTFHLLVGVVRCGHKRFSRVSVRLVLGPQGSILWGTFGPEISSSRSPIRVRRRSIASSRSRLSFPRLDRVVFSRHRRARWCSVLRAPRSLMSSAARFILGFLLADQACCLVIPHTFDFFDSS